MEEGEARSKFKRVCVFCGSNSGHRQVFSDAALELGNELVGVCLFLETGVVVLDYWSSMFPTIYWVIVSGGKVSLLMFLIP
ncbi:hypothetical protein QUC31_020513 [Theobroma cacao]